MKYTDTWDKVVEDGQNAVVAFICYVAACILLGMIAYTAWHHVTNPDTEACRVFEDGSEQCPDGSIIPACDSPDDVWHPRCAQ